MRRSLHLTSGKPSPWVVGRPPTAAISHAAAAAAKTKTDTAPTWGTTAASTVDAPKEMRTGVTLPLLEELARCVLRRGRRAESPSGLMQRVPGLMPVHKPVHLDFADYARGTLWIIQHSTTPDPS